MITYRFSTTFNGTSIDEEFTEFPHSINVGDYRFDINSTNNVKLNYKVPYSHLEYQTNNPGLKFREFIGLTEGSGAIDAEVEAVTPCPHDHYYVYYLAERASVQLYYWYNHEMHKVVKVSSDSFYDYYYPYIWLEGSDLSRLDEAIGLGESCLTTNPMNNGVITGYYTSETPTTYSYIAEDYSNSEYTITSDESFQEEFVTLNGLKKYDRKKGTAEVDVTSLPLTPEHRVYVKHNNNKTVETVWAKDVELATEYDVQNNIKYVSTVPSSNITSKLYGKVGAQGSFSCTESDMEAETDAMKAFFDFSSGTTKVPLYYNNKQIHTFAKPDTVYEFYDDLGNVLADLTNDITINYVESNKYYAGDLTNQTTTELATADAVKATYIPLNQKAKPKGVATLDANGRIPEEQLPLAALVYKGEWDASTGVFPVGTFVSGDFFIVSVAGTINGVDYAVGDWIIYNGSSWDLSENQNDVHSVNGKVGVVVLKDEDIDTAALPTGATVDYYTPETDTIQDALIKHDNELTSQDVRLDRIEAETNAEHTKQVTFFVNEAAIPTTTTDIFFFGIGEYAYAIAEQTWYKLTAINTTTKALTWTQVDVGFQRTMVAGEGININNLTNTISNTSRIWEGTQAEYNSLTAADKVGIALFIITDSIGTGVTVDDVVEDGNLNAVTSNAVYDAVQELSDNSKAIEYVPSLPASGIKDRIYGVEQSGAVPKFYAGDADNQSTYKLGGSDIFVGTQAEWNALTTAEKNEYSQANITDANSTVFIPVDTIADGNMNPPTSNAVYDAMTTKRLTTGAPVITPNSNVASLNQRWIQINSNTYQVCGNIVLNSGITPGTQVLTLPFNSLFGSNLMLVSLDQDGRAQWLGCEPNSNIVANPSYTNHDMLSGNWVFSWILSKVI